MQTIKALTELGHVAAGHFTLHKVGDVLEVSEKDAKRFVDLGAAELVKVRAKAKDEDADTSG